MTEAKKYSHLTEQDIQLGLKNGNYKKGKTTIIDNESGQIVKHINDTTTNTFFLPYIYTS